MLFILQLEFFRKIIHSSNYRDDLILITDTGEYCISENVKIYSNWYHKKFMIVVCCNDKRVFLIDSRGILNMYHKFVIR